MTMRTSQLLLLFALLTPIAAVSAHGNVTPQAVDTEGLPPVDGWSDHNPYRALAPAQRAKIEKMGDTAYHQTCAGCHGLGAKSGGIAPDLRLLAPETDDGYFVSRIRTGGRGMPQFEGILQPEAAWAIKTWLDTLHEAAMEERYGP
jgi:cytochrome c-550 PedF